MKKILFSPVGGTDPISENNLFDGSLLHICRCYQPDVVYLYMSKEILEHHRKDDRYLYCLHRLDEMQHRKTEYHVIERPDMENVQNYDTFYQDFRTEIQKIADGMDAEDILYLNVSSGTPAMKSGLLVLKTLGEISCTAIQVLTPAKKMNEHTHKENDIETLWTLNNDNQDDYENRCIEVECPTLSNLYQENIIKNLIQKYDYAGALAVAETMPAKETEYYLAWLKLAYFRSQINLREVSKILNGKQVSYSLPVQDSELCKYFEYALTLQVRIKREEYADFARALSPILVWLFERILKVQAQIEVDDYCYYDKEGVRKWSSAKLSRSGQHIYQVLCREFSDFRGGTVYGSAFVPLIDEFCKENSALCRLVDELRAVEKEVRNLAAHQVECITAQKIQDDTGFSVGQIQSKLRRAFTYAGMNIRENQWQSYEEMNETILKEISRSHG